MLATINDGAFLFLLSDTFLYKGYEKIHTHTHTQLHKKKHNSKKGCECLLN